MGFLKHLTAALAVVSSVEALKTSLNGPRLLPVDLYAQTEARRNGLQKRDDTDPSLLYPEHNLSVPIDHFHNESRYEPHSSGTFNLRYWFDAKYYKPGGPVIVLQSGETDASERLPFLQKGLLHELIEATNGIGVVIEHRYYGTSFPVPDLSVENLRFLTTEQALADEAYFAQHIKFPGLGKYGDLTSKTTPYIGYGGSYAGAFNAFLRVQYPDVFWGTISSSGVTEAIYDYWQYFNGVTEYGPRECVKATQTLTHVVDNILIGKKHNHALGNKLKSAFGLGEVKHDADFASAISGGITGWQSLNWDPSQSDPSVYEYCDTVSNTKVHYPATESLRSTAADLIKEGGYAPKTELVNQMLNYIGYVNATTLRSCARHNLTIDDCTNSYTPEQYQHDGLDTAENRSWPWQYCTEFGFLQTGSGVPKDKLPVVSRLMDLEYESIVCRESFNITTPPDTARVNKYGGYDISYPRLAIVDGQWDPWRAATPHAFEEGAHNRVSTTEKPFILIPQAVHHWDENGLLPNQTTSSLPPARIVKVHNEEIAFVKQWVKEFQDQCDKNGRWPWSGWPWNGWHKGGNWTWGQWHQGHKGRW